MDQSSERTSAPSVFIVKEQIGEPLKHYENELDRGLIQAAEIIVIEPQQLGDETASWITVGNFFHKLAVLSGFGSILVGIFDKKLVYSTLALGGVSGVCVGIYSLSWQHDPCCKYQVEKDSKKLSLLPMELINCATPVVLVRKDDRRRKILHNVVFMLAATVSSWRLLRHLMWK